jgi:hypothetical protein
MPSDVDDGETNAEVDRVSLLCHDLKGHYEGDVLGVPRILLGQIDGRSNAQQRR